MEGTIPSGWNAAHFHVQIFRTSVQLREKKNVRNVRPTGADNVKVEICILDAEEKKDNRFGQRMLICTSRHPADGAEMREKRRTKEEDAGEPVAAAP